MSDSVRGVRNNNPLNIRRSKDQWVGLALDQSTDKDFFVFISPEMGFRAAYKILLTYKNKYQIYTIDDIVSRWAPPLNRWGEKENDTERYINAVENITGINRHDIVTTDNYPALLSAMSKVETGRDYSMDIINSGIALA